MSSRPSSYLPSSLLPFSPSVQFWNLQKRLYPLGGALTDIGKVGLFTHSYAKTQQIISVPRGNVCTCSHISDYHHSLLNDLNGFKSHESTLSITFGELDSVSLMSCTVETNYHARHFSLSPAGSICMQTASDRNRAPGSFLASINHFVFTQTSENINMCSLPPCEPGVSSQSAQIGLETQI